MSLTTTTPSDPVRGVGELVALLREARARRRISQLDLSLELGISQRHLSFVELGRARPSRDLLLRWLGQLDVPLPERNRALVAAGHAPAYDDSPLGAPELAEQRAALAHLLASHDPWPAFVIDAAWNLVAANAGAARLFAVLGVEVAEEANLLDLALGPLAGLIVNLPEVAASLLEQLRAEAVHEPSLRERLALVEAAVADLPAPTGPRFPPTLVTRYASTAGELAFLSMFTTFGTPHSVTLASLRAELMFPADDATRAVLAAEPSPQSSGS
ncbi:helix-turn-helix transcriptional regulator [Nocardioides sp.]|uniref:helix-turn-helix transcriptional regulator n=1 Tax=Nocardioides sp. TaxID=35761 RepID=UPI003513E271